MSLNKDFGEYGGQFVPETLMNTLKTLEREYLEYCSTDEFKNDFIEYMRQYVGRPSVCITLTDLQK